jgi:hypothetical protein
VWYELFVHQYLHQDETTNRLDSRSHINSSTMDFNFLQPHFPNLRFPKAHISRHSSRETQPASDLVFDSYPDIAPFLGRLIATNQIDPLFSVTLQRDTIDKGGNAGRFYIGQLPPGVQNDSLTWVPVRRYSEAEGGLSGPSDAPHEVGQTIYQIIHILTCPFITAYRHTLSRGRSFSKISTWTENSFRAQISPHRTSDLALSSIP